MMLSDFGRKTLVHGFTVTQVSYATAEEGTMPSASL